ncbi:hypothetical protein Tco_1007044 [Tanacetum coccineum]|uniref:Uncharacterized protein n=1 Tax=Tanacetum coccineum TaxID=301880 RepID=A0ABQ5FJQ6_9ASTR
MIDGSRTLERKSYNPRGLRLKRTQTQLRERYTTKAREKQCPTTKYREHISQSSQYKTKAMPHHEKESGASHSYWKQKVKLEYKFQDQKNSEDIFSIGSALEDFIFVVFVRGRNIVKTSLVDTTVTLIPETTLSPQSQPPQTKRRKSKVLLKKSNKPESQVDSGELESKVTRLEKTVAAMSRFNLPEAIDKSVKAHLKNVLPKDVLDFALDEYDQNDKLFQMLMKSKSFDKHPAHKALYDALVQSLHVDEDDIDRVVNEPPTQKRR